MKTFENIPKSRLIEELEKHAAADAFMQGVYWEDGKGCAVGCTLQSFGERTDDHAAFERLFGIPEELARLEDRIFEGLTAKESKEWPLRFSKAVPEGVDLTPVATNFKIRLLEECLVFDREKNPCVDKAVHQVIQALKGNGSLSAAWSAAWSAAESAARSAAWSAAESAAESAAWSAARSAAWSAAWSAAESAARSAAESAAESAAWSAAWSAAESAAESAAWSAAWSKIATILIEEMEKVQK